MHVGIVGAAGLVGELMRSTLAERDFPAESMRLFASARSAGKSLRWKDSDVVVEDAAKADYSGLDVVFILRGRVDVASVGAGCRCGGCRCHRAAAARRAFEARKSGRHEPAASPQRPWTEAARRLGTARKFAFVTVQRKLKDAGRFRIKGDASYLRFVDPTIAKVKAALHRAGDDPLMRELAEL